MGTTDENISFVRSLSDPVSNTRRSFANSLTRACNCKRLNPRSAVIYAGGGYGGGVIGASALVLSSSIVENGH